MVIYRVVVIFLLLTYCVLHTSSVKKRPSTRKRPNDQMDQGVEDDKNRSLRDWLNLPRVVLDLACNRYGLTSTGSIETVANRLFTNFNAHEQFSNTIGAPTCTVTTTSNRQVRVSPASHGQSARAPAETFTATVPDIATPIIHPATDSQSFPTASIAEIVRNEVRALCTSMGLQSTYTAAPNTSAVQPDSLRNLPNHNDNDNISRNGINLPNNNINNLRNNTAWNTNHNGFQVSNNLPNTLPIENVNNNNMNNNIQVLHNLPNTFSNVNNHNGASIVDYRSNNVGPSSSLPSCPTRVLAQIRNREYINFNNLLPSAVATSNDDFSVQVNTDTNEFHVSSGTPRSQSRPKVRDLTSWLGAWNTFIRATTYFYPHLSSPMLCYQTYICKYAAQYEFSAWSTYDIMFRQALANDPQMSWDRVDNELFNSYIQSGQLLRSVCYTCRRPGHLTSNCPQRQVTHRSSSNTNNYPTNNHPANSNPAPQPFRAPQRPMLPSTSNIRTCVHFNNRGCTNPRCTYAHQCNICSDHHPATHCPKRKYSA